jgi:hypothetical protein
MALTDIERAAVIAKMLSAEGTISVDGLSASGPSISELIKLLEWDAKTDTASTTTQPFRIQHLRSPGSIYGS